MTDFIIITSDYYKTLDIEARKQYAEPVFIENNGIFEITNEKTDDILQKKTSNFSLIFIDISKEF